MTDLAYAELHDLAKSQVTDIACPLCGPKARHGSNRVRKVMRVWDKGWGYTYHCERCQASGWARAGQGASRIDYPRETPTQAPQPDKSDLARRLWLLARPLAGSPAEAYLAARRCPVASPFLRYLPEQGWTPHALLARFCETGVHLTRLAKSGLAKADIDKPKIMIGLSKGHPIRVRNNPERAELVIAEGIEDAATLGNAMNATAWAAGSAGRIGSIIPGEGWDNVWLAVDTDEAGRSALAEARSVNPDIIPLDIGNALGARTRLDANGALTLYGPEVIEQAIDWCDITAARGRGLINHNTAAARLARLTMLRAAVG